MRPGTAPGSIHTVMCAGPPHEANEWRGATRRKKVRTTIPDRRPGPDLVDRHFGVESLNVLLVAVSPTSGWPTGRSSTPRSPSTLKRRTNRGLNLLTGKNDAFVRRAIRPVHLGPVREKPCR